MYGSNGTEDEDKEISLASDNNKMVCYNCREVGHKAYKCPTQRNKNRGYSNKRQNGSRKFNGKFNGQFNICGKDGHKAKDCWKDPN